MAAQSFLITVLADVIRGMNDRGTEYALAGGLAYGALVEPRATTDVDLLILLDRPARETVATLFSSVFESVIPHSEPMVFKRLSIWRVVGMREGREVIVDLLLAQSDFLKSALERKRTVDFQGLALPIVTLEDLIILKAIAGRLQDRADIEKITQRPELRVDWDYVREWQVKLGLDPIR